MSLKAGWSQQDQQLLDFLPYWTLDPPEERSPHHRSTGEDVDSELVVLDAVPLFARVLPPTVAQEEGVVDFPLANGKLMLNFVPLRTKMLNLLLPL